MSADEAARLGARVVDTDQDLYDSTGPWRRRAIAGTLHSGELAADDR